MIQGNSLISQQARKPIDLTDVDDPPWDTAPTDVTEVSQRVQGPSGEDAARGFIIFPVIRDGAGVEKSGPTVTYVVWIKDNANGVQDADKGWVSTDAQALIGHRMGRQAFGVQNGIIFIQLTTSAGGAAGDTVEFRLMPTTGT